MTQTLCGPVRYFAWPFTDEDSGGSFFTPEPIRFKINRKRMPFNPHVFFRVVYDVDNYPKFIPTMPGCKKDRSSAYEVKQTDRSTYYS